MARPAKILPLETSRGWMVATPKSMAADGRRHQRFFKDRTAAEKFAAGLRASYSKGFRGSLISHSLATQAAEAEKILAGSGISLAEAARLAVGRLSGGKAETFQDRWKRAVADGENHWSKRYQMDMSNLPNKLPASFMKVRCDLIDRPAMEKALLKRKPGLSRSTIDVWCRWISAVLGYRERHRKSASIVILSVRECARLLRACEGPDERRTVALLLFAGIRPDAEDGEISRLDWSAVGASEIYVSAEVSKTNSDRHIPLTPRLHRLIRGHPESGPVMPANWRRSWARLRKAAGIVATDVCRHTFASNLLAYHGGDEGKTKLAMGHAAGSSVLMRHYKRAVTEEAGRRFFG